MRHQYTVTGMHCSSCVMNVEEALLDVPGITDAEASLKAGIVRVEHDESVAADAIHQAIREAGYEVVAG